MIEAQAVTFCYPGQRQPALLRVSLMVERGEVVGIVGPNGSGKSTVSRLLKGLYVPDEGEVVVDGVTTLDSGLEVRRLVGMVFQNPNSQIVNAVVEQEVAFGPENLGLPPREIRARVRAALQAVGLLGLETAECHSLSMANKQRVALAGILAMEPRYLILDEATAWLEPAARRPLLDEVIGWCHDREVGLILVTHRMDEAQRCHRLYGMLHGEVAAQGTPVDVLHDVDVRARLALELPETLALVEDLRAAGVPIDADAGIDRLAEVLWPS